MLDTAAVVAAAVYIYCFVTKKNCGWAWRVDGNFLPLFLPQSNEIQYVALIKQKRYTQSKRGNVCFSSNLFQNQRHSLI